MDKELEERFQNEELVKPVGESEEIVDVEVNDTTEQFDLLALQEEYKRIVKLDNYKVNTSKDTKLNDFYKSSKVYTETLIEMLHRLIESGVDYTNALAFCNNLVINNENLKQAEKQLAQIKDNSL